MSTPKVATHAPEPWESIVTETGYDIEDGNGSIIAELRDRSDASASAYLMAAAPELLEALIFTRSMIGGLETLHIGSSWWTLVNTVIAKAQGMRS